MAPIARHGSPRSSAGSLSWSGRSPADRRPVVPTFRGPASPHASRRSVSVQPLEARSARLPAIRATTPHGNGTRIAPTDSGWEISLWADHTHNCRAGVALGYAMATPDYRIRLACACIGSSEQGGWPAFRQRHRDRLRDGRAGALRTLQGGSGPPERRTLRGQSVRGLNTCQSIVCQSLGG